MLNKRILYILFFLVSFYNAYSQIGTPFFKNYTPKEYNSHAQIWAIEQDYRGIMYFGTSSGLVEYDGAKWKQLLNGFTRSLEISPDGTLHVGLINDFGFMKPDSNMNLKYHSLIHLLDSADLNFNDVWDIGATKKYIYFSSSQNIYQYNPLSKKIKTIKAKSYFRLGGVVNDKFYIQDQNTGIVEVNNDSIAILKGTEKLPTMVVLNIHKYSEKELLIQGFQQLYLYNFNTQKLLELDIEFKDIIYDKKIYTSSLSLQKDVILATSFFGGFVFDKNNQLKYIFNTNNGLNDDKCWTSHITPNNILWLGLNNGIFKAEIDSPYQRWGKAQGLNGIIWSITKHNNTLYIGTDKGLQYIDNKLDKNFQNNIKDVKDISGTIFSFCNFKIIDNNNKIADSLFLVAGEYGLFSLKNHKVLNQFTSEMIFTIKQSKFHPNRLYFGGRQGMGYLTYKNKKWKATKWKTNPVSDIWYLTEINKNEIWFSTFNNGYIKANIIDTDSVTFEHISKKHNYNEKNAPTAIQINNELLFPTYNSFIKFNQKTNQFEPAHEINNKIGKRVDLRGRQANDEKGNFWFSNLGKIIQIKVTGKSITVDSLTFPELNAQSSPQIYYSNNELWIGTENYIYKYQINHKNQQLKNFITLFREISIGSESIIYQGYTNKNKLNNHDKYSIKLSINDIEFKDNAVNIKYASPLYVKNEQLEYSYQLIKNGKIINNWSDWNQKNYKHFTYLNEGEYIFNVKAKAYNGEISKIAQLNFKILPPWYRTTIAYIIFIILAVLIIFIIIKISILKLKKDKERLEAIVKKRTQELIAKNDEINAQAEELRTANDELVYMNLKLELLSIAARETDNSIFILNNKGDFIWGNESGLQKYEYTIHELLNKQKNIKKISNNPNIEKYLNKCISEKKPVIYETAFTTKNNRKRYTQTTLSPILDMDGNIDKIVAIDSNIEELKNAQHIIKQKNELITSSIRYAQNIQNATLPSSEQLNNEFETFIIFKPKDIVSGDFYWYSKINTKTFIIAIVDCTGHGVPGALMSMISTQILKEIVNERKIHEPDKILKTLDADIRKALKQDNTNNQDGLDIALCKIIKNSNYCNIEYSGAKRNLYYLKKDENKISYIKAARRSIGGIKPIREIPFTKSELQLKKDSLLYLFTDGIIDQCNILRKRFSTKYLIELLEKNQNLSLKKQKKTIEKHLNDFMKDTEQRDDISFIGIKL